MTGVVRICFFKQISLGQCCIGITIHKNIFNSRNDIFTDHRIHFLTKKFFRAKLLKTFEILKVLTFSEAQVCSILLDLILLHQSFSFKSPCAHQTVHWWWSRSCRAEALRTAVGAARLQGLCGPPNTRPRHSHWVPRRP